MGSHAALHPFLTAASLNFSTHCLLQTDEISYIFLSFCCQHSCCLHTSCSCATLSCLKSTQTVFLQVIPLLPLVQHALSIHPFIDLPQSQAEVGLLHNEYMNEEAHCQLGMASLGRAEIVLMCTSKHELCIQAYDLVDNPEPRQAVIGARHEVLPTVYLGKRGFQNQRLFHTYRCQSLKQTLRTH